MRPLFHVLSAFAFITAIAADAVFRDGIVGPTDDRQEVRNFENVVSKRIGVVHSAGTSGSAEECTGFLIDSRLVLTANHCINGDGHQNRSPLTRTTFRWNAGYLTDSQSETARQVFDAQNYCSGGYQPSLSRTNPDTDWAILVLTSPVPDLDPITQEIPFAKYGPSIGEPLSMIGYSASFNLRVSRETPFYVTQKEEDCTIQKAPQTWSQDTSIYFLHNCDAGPGSSGSPIFLFSENRPWELTGIAHAEQPKVGLNQAVTATNFRETAEAMIRAAREGSLDDYIQANLGRCR